MATILIVDDHVLSRNFLLTLLGYGGHRLLEASDGAKALAILQSDQCDLVITDILMPNMDGYEFVTRLRAEPSIAAVKVIFYTAAYREREANIMALACNVQRVLPKPSDPEIILQAVQDVLGLPSATAESISLTPPPPEGSRFSTIGNQLAEYLVELEASSRLLFDIAHRNDNLVVSGKSELGEMAQRLSRSLSSLQAVSLRLTTLIELGIELAAERDAPALIEAGCRVAQNICVAKYAAIGILDESGERLSHFVTRGLDDDTRARLGFPPPRGGIIGTLLEKNVPHRMHGIGGDPKALGLPPAHPPVHSLLWVPIASKERLYGWIYLADKLGATEFSEVDERVVTTITAQLAVAYENLLLFDEIRKNQVQLEAEMAARMRVDEHLQRFRGAMDASYDAIFLLDRATMRFIDVNERACIMLGYSRDELLELDPTILCGSPLEELAGMYDSVIANEILHESTDMELYRKDGSTLPVEMVRRAVKSGEKWIMLGTARDITERKEAEQRLLHLAHYDPLTGLPNRMLFFDSLQKAISFAQENQTRLAVLFIDVDRFKHVNDTLGHPTGDELLRQFALRVVGCVRARDTVGRIGGDEFALIATMTNDEQIATNIAVKIQEALQRPFNLQGHEVTLAASVGITVYPDDGSDPETLIKYADIAMYKAKDAGRDTYRFFTAEMNIQAQKRLELENALRKAIENDEFVLHYQPQVEIDTGRVVCMEALIRWRRPGYGLVLPGEFIPLLEETGLIIPVGAWVIDAACRQIGVWMESLPRPMAISVNVSAKQFLSPSLESDIVSIIDKHEISPELLELELTESTLLVNTARTITLLDHLKSLGVRISIDDFGTGYSSLAYLKRFPIDKLKIDIAFVREITTNPDDATITRAIIHMAHSLKLRVVAEGVETEAQLSYLRRHGCAQMQGYYFSRPVPPEDVPEIMKQEKSFFPADSDHPQVRRQTLLIVDDDVVVLTVLAMLLRQDGYEVLTAGSAAEGFELLALNPVQVILCDQQMPEMNGTEFLDRVKDLHPDTFRIVLSGHTELEPIMDAINRGALYRFYTKPWKNEVLRDNIREAFRHYWFLHGALDENTESNPA